MAELTERLAENVAGEFYTTAQCIDCDMCRETAPGLFKRDDNIGFSVVYRQPASPEEQRQAEEALEGCPVEAIGKDGSPR